MVSFADNDRAQLLARIGELEAKVAALQDQADQAERVAGALAQSNIGERRDEQDRACAARRH